MDRVAISVIIPTYNRKGLLLQTLQSLFVQQFPHEDYEIIVAVDGSADGSAQAVRMLSPPCALRVLEQENRGQASARNSAARVACGELLLFLDDDTICEPSLLSCHEAAQRGLEASVVFGPVLISPESPRSIAVEWQRWSTARYVARLSAAGEPLWPTDTLLDANSSVPRSVWLRCGGFDETFKRTRETLDLGLRLWNMGVRFRYVPGAIVRQVYVKSSRDLVQGDAESFGRNEVMLCRKHPAYRRYSPLSALSRGPIWRKLIRHLIACMPVSPDLLLRLPLRLLEKTRPSEKLCHAGVRLLQLCMAIRMVRSAVRAAGSWRRLRHEFGQRLPVLLYHRVGPAQPGTYPELSISAKRFRRHVRWLRLCGYTGIAPSQWLAWLREGKPLPRKPVLITFDDAYSDISKHALPVLQTAGFGAGVFVVTGQLGGSNVWDEVRGSASLKLMTAEEIRSWSLRGIEFGAHSRTHTDLRDLAPCELGAEISGSCADLTRVLGTRPSSFAYPYGFHNAVVRGIVSDSFDIAFTCSEGLNDIMTDAFSIRRTMVRRSDSVIDILLRVRFGVNWMDLVRARLRIRTRLRSVFACVRTLVS